MQDDHAIKELLNAKEGEQVQFKIYVEGKGAGARWFAE